MSQEGVPKKYGWKGWKMPILHLDDADYCEYGCPVCTGARRGSQVYRILLTLETILTFGGCPFCRARTRKYGVKPGEAVTSVNSEFREVN